jgi:tetratricopeptide (TPR) repeat protein
VARLCARRAAERSSVRVLRDSCLSCVIGCGDYTEAIRLELMNPSEFKAVNYRSLLYFEPGGAYSSLKQYAEAVSDYTEAIRLKPDSTSAYWARGNAYYYGLKEYNKAISDYTETIRLWPSNAMSNVALIYECRAAAYEKLGDRSRAGKDRKKAKELKGR